MAPVLLSRTLDPILGIFTGIFAYHLYETNPRTELPEEQKLVNLVRWKMEKSRNERAHKAEEEARDNVDWKEVVAEAEK
ncbi:hypothetical protein EWM64_g295 [Hericium alpestre]|uniref:Uncharacterized protein n=1 Tax=Hericium alpestre TaxID=135208 RepID=A0A4Z0A9H7_9AGAM|nr:hypothetical protein EWM64_g295 [Hericium alpestre]